MPTGALHACPTLLLLALAAPAVADEPWSLTVYLQQSFPKQTNTNRQIEQINQAFGVDFETWDDVANLSVGTQLFRRLSQRLELGVELDFSRGGISGSDTVQTEAGPASLEFEQSYSVYADALAVAHVLPCPSCAKARPFVLLGAGIGYERDTTTLTLGNDLFQESLRVENDGAFGVATVGAGLDVRLGERFFLQGGVAYYWGRLKHQVPASGSLAPAPTVEADNDTTGPNYWIGAGLRW